MTEYYLNGKKVDKDTVSKRKNKTLVETETCVRKYYEAPLNDEEKLEQEVQAVNSAKFFKEMRDIREDQEKFH